MRAGAPCGVMSRLHPARSDQMMAAVVTAASGMRGRGVRIGVRGRECLLQRDWLRTSWAVGVGQCPVGWHQLQASRGLVRSMLTVTATVIPTANTTAVFLATQAVPHTLTLPKCLITTIS